MDRRIFLCFFLGFFLTGNCIANITQNKNQLSHINQSINQVKTQLASEKKRRLQLQQQLKNTALAAKQANATIHKTETQLSKQQAQMSALNRKITKSQNVIATQETKLSTQIRAAYMLAHPSFLKLLLGQANTASVDRLRTYYQYLAKDQAQSIQHLHSNIQLLGHYKSKTQRQAQHLKTLKIQQQQQQQQLEQLKQHRQNILHQINDHISSKNHYLQQLLNNKAVLEQTITRLQKEQTYTVSHFSALKSHLTWPVTGKIIHQFGTKIYQSELRWNAVVMKVATHQPIHAIAAGKVVFANSLPGYGLLIIINHGNGFMSLYGRNYRLYKKVGDLIHTGDTIAITGKTGDFPSPSLYFSIRQNGKPLDPAIWCKK